MRDSLSAPGRSLLVVALLAVPGLAACGAVLGDGDGPVDQPPVVAPSDAAVPLDSGPRVTATRSPTPEPTAEPSDVASGAPSQDP